MKLSKKKNFKLNDRELERIIWLLIPATSTLQELMNQIPDTTRIRRLQKLLVASCDAADHSINLLEYMRAELRYGDDDGR